ncbi:MAG: phosphatase PAP2 family protein [Bacteroidaceae bacterium]|nr:phosphatase PAP2 family protein [Bacteroidaceae bacterium]
MEAIDQEVLLLINGSNSCFLDFFMPLVSGKLEWLPLYLAVLFVLCRRLRFSWQLLAVLATIGVTFFLTDFCCSHIIRPMFNRLRPVCYENPVHTLVNAVQGYRHNSYGFPSCHASNTFGLAMLVCLFVRNRWDSIFMFLWAAAICYSRVYLGVHYPGDVLVGAVIGMLCGWLTYTISSALQKKYLPNAESVHDQYYVIAITGCLVFASMAAVSLIIPNS